jgi:DNA-binding NtrC family response regulator
MCPYFIQFMPSNTILIIDDDRDVLDALRVLLEDDFKEIITESNAHRIASLAKNKYDAILLDMNFSAGINSGNEGLYWLGEVLKANAAASVVMMTAYGNIGLAVEAIKRGAKDFVLKPWDNDKLIATIKACISLQKPAEIKIIPDQNHFIEGRSKIMATLHEQIRKVAATDASVLILGENGTGKEVVARELHRLSNRAGKIFVPVDLSTLTPNLFESELFGHKKGAFTDARADRKGRFETANEGTLFLDEIGNLPIEQQAKLLTVLQNRTIVPVGSNDPVPINIRLLTATNAPLLQLAEQGLFRQDLLYRINTITLIVPPLRDRGEDIITLAEHFLNHYRTQYNKPGIRFGAEAKNILLHYTWPGNVRELQHTLEKAIILTNNETLTAGDFNLSISSRPVQTSPLKTLDDLEKEALQQALHNHKGNIVHAAKALGITRQTFYNKMKKYGI